MTDLGSTISSETLPGLDIAESMLAFRREVVADLDLLTEDMDDDTTLGKATVSTARNAHPSLALDALMILRLFASTKARSVQILPAAGALSVIQTMRPSDSARLKALFRDRKSELLSAIDGCAQKTRLADDLQLVQHMGAEAGRLDTARFIETVETAVLAGLPCLVFLSGTQPLTPELRTIVSSDLMLCPADAVMLAALFSMLHKSSIAPSDLPKSGIAMLTELQLAQTFYAATAAEAVARLHQLCAPACDAAHVTLDQVYGQPQATEAFAHLLEDVADWHANRLAWHEVTSSFLLYGPPGTGKTRLATALAGSARLPFVMTSYSDCQKHGHQGDMLRELNSAGERAISQAPAVFFIDEIDSFYSRARGNNNGYIQGVVNGLLTLLDRLNGTDGVIVVAATNHPDAVDPAIIRAGRFDRHIAVGALERAGIRAMLTTELGTGVLNEAECRELADQLSGCTGADVATLIRAARTKARRAKAVLNAQHVRDAADGLSPRPEPGLQSRIAFHEAGHLLAGHLFGLPSPERAQLIARYGYVESPEFDFLTPERILSQIRSDLGGYAAEQLVFGTASSGSGGDASSDLARATRRLLLKELSFGFGETITWQAASTDLQHISDRQRERIERELQEALAETRAALHAHRADLERIAETLLRERELNRQQIAALLSDIHIASVISQSCVNHEQKEHSCKLAKASGGYTIPG